MSILVALPLQGLFTLAAAMVAGRGTTRVGLSATLALGALLSPLLLPAEHTFLRFLASASSMPVAFRVLDLARDERMWSVRDRVWLFTAVLDTRRITKTEPRLDPASVAKLMGYLVLGSVGYFIASWAPALAAGPASIVRWLGGALLIYSAADAANYVSIIVYEAKGMRIPPQHDAPITAPSVGAFWSKHYNLNVSDWLARNFYRPFARRRQPLLGLGVAFIVSALFHMWICWVSLDLAMALMMGAFFLVQGVLIAIERAARQGRWRMPIRRAWTLTWMLLFSPLFVEPFLRIVGI